MLRLGQGTPSFLLLHLYFDRRWRIHLSIQMIFRFRCQHFITLIRINEGVTVPWFLILRTKMPTIGEASSVFSFSSAHDSPSNSSRADQHDSKSPVRAFLHHQMSCLHCLQLRVPLLSISYFFLLLFTLLRVLPVSFQCLAVPRVGFISTRLLCNDTMYDNHFVEIY